ncbi:MAG: hypothetical protein VB859_18145, partial [Planctomycetaceae bacterium]
LDNGHINIGHPHGVDLQESGHWPAVSVKNCPAKCRHWQPRRPSASPRPFSYNARQPTFFLFDLRPCPTSCLNPAAFPPLKMDSPST